MLEFEVKLLIVVRYLLIVVSIFDRRNDVTILNTIDIQCTTVTLIKSPFISKIHIQTEALEVSSGDFFHFFSDT